MKLHEEIGRVTGARMFIEDHGILTFFVDLEFGAGGQGFGGYCLDSYDESKKRRVGTAAGIDLILRLMNFFMVDELGKAKGCVVVALREEPYGQVVGLRRMPFDGGASFLISEWKAEWFDEDGKPRKFYEESRREGSA